MWTKNIHHCKIVISCFEIYSSIRKVNPHNYMETPLERHRKKKERNHPIRPTTMRRTGLRIRVHAPSSSFAQRWARPRSALAPAPRNKRALQHPSPEVSSSTPVSSFYEELSRGSARTPISGFTRIKAENSSRMQKTRARTRHTEEAEI